MIITINNKSIILPSDIITISELVAWKQIPVNGTAIAINGKIARRDDWDSIRLQNEDSLTVISAAFGG